MRSTLTASRHKRPPRLFGLEQKHWRIAGAVTIGCGALMALYAVTSGILRDTVIHVVRFLAPEAAVEAVPAAGAAFVSVYWVIFFLFIATSVYLAFVDLRYIRLQYALEQRAIYGRTLGDGEFRDSLVDRSEGDS